MTARRYVVRLAREVRQEATVSVLAESLEEAMQRAPLFPVRWENDEITEPWTVEIRDAGPTQP